METWTKEILEELLEEMQLVDMSNEKMLVVFSVVKVFDKGLKVVYRTYNHETECGGFETTATIRGDIDKIFENLNYIIFDCVNMKKRKFENIAIQAKTITGTKKHLYQAYTQKLV